jgi:predicted polyphosphate/ATP-dependent NAD kinase
LLKIALIVNPLAGIGGSVALKGSDGADVQREARARHGVARGKARAHEFLEQLQAAASTIRWYAPRGSMGGDTLAELDMPFTGLDTHSSAPVEPTTAADTRDAVISAQTHAVDLIVFVGGDGTARDVLAVVDPKQPVLGVPAGVKMHSGVFGVTPRAAAELVGEILKGGLVSVQHRAVRDFDAESTTTVATKHYGELLVPESGRFLQHTKVAGRESEPIALQEIVADVVEHWQGHDLLVGPGSTCFAIKEALGLGEPTLIGFDCVIGDAWHRDLTAEGIEEMLRETKRKPGDQRLHVVLSFTRAQGFLLGRGNQQLTPDLLRAFDWPKDFTVVGTRTKLLSLDGRPLLLDTDAPELDAALSGLIEITTGYEDRLLYRVAAVG